jgi:hypothetical protein
MLSSGKIAAPGQPIALILMRAFDALASPRQGTLLGSVQRRHWLPRLGQICSDKGLGLPLRRQRYLPNVIAVLKEIIGPGGSVEGNVRAIWPHR